MAKKDDPTPQVARARALRERIDALTRGEIPTPRGPESPRDFIERRMRELTPKRAKSRTAKKAR